MGPATPDSGSSSRADDSESVGRSEPPPLAHALLSHHEAIAALLKPTYMYPWPEVLPDLSCRTVTSSPGAPTAASVRPSYATVADRSASSAPSIGLRPPTSRVQRGLELMTTPPSMTKAKPEMNRELPSLFCHACRR